MEAIPLTQLQIPQLQGLKNQVLRLFNTGNRVRVSSDMTAESSNDLSNYANQIQDEIDSRQINNANT